MTLKADPDDDDEIQYVFESVSRLLNFFDSSRSELEEREKVLEILDFLAEQGINFTEKRQ